MLKQTVSVFVPEAWEAPTAGVMWPQEHQTDFNTSEGFSLSGCIFVASCLFSLSGDGLLTLTHPIPSCLLHYSSVKTHGVSKPAENEAALTLVTEQNSYYTWDCEERKQEWVKTMSVVEAWSNHCDTDKKTNVLNNSGVKDKDLALTSVVLISSLVRTDIVSFFSCLYPSHSHMSERERDTGPQAGTWTKTTGA